MARNKLTATQVKAAVKPGKHGDGDGLYLQVSKAGRKSWVFVFIRSGRRREMGLGPLEGVSSVSLAQARVKADEIRAILGRGGDLFTEMAERASRKKIVRFGEVSDQLIDSLKSEWKNDKHIDQWKMTMQVYAKPLRRLPVSEITVNDVVKVLQPIWNEKRETARRTRGRIEKVLDHARARGLRDGENPARWKGNLSEILPSGRQLKRGHHAALPYSEAPTFLE